MTYRRIKPPNGWIMPKKAGLYRACVLGDKSEYEQCEQKIIAAYNKANKRDGL